MILAALFLFASFMAFAPALGAQTEPSAAPAPAAKPSQSQEAPTPPQSPATTQPTSPPMAPASHTATTAKQKNHKKKVTASPCKVSSPGPAAPNSNSQSPAPGSTSNGSAQASGTTTPSTDCPPPKTIVRHGGTKDPSIQLAGAPKADQSAQKRDTINQLLGVTDQNLKKTAGMQLSPEQQDTVTQTRQFIDQSKAAMAEGDLERARTLAWKAELLSEDLANPEK